MLFGGMKGNGVASALCSTSSLLPRSIRLPSIPSSALRYKQAQGARIGESLRDVGLEQDEIRTLRVPLVILPADRAREVILPAHLARRSFTIGFHTASSHAS